MHSHERRIVRRIYRVGRGIGQARIAEADEDAGVVVPVAARVRQQEIEAQHEILKLQRGIEEQPDTPAILLLDGGPFLLPEHVQNLPGLGGGDKQMNEKNFFWSSDQ